MVLAGVTVPDRFVLELARTLRNGGHGDTAARLGGAQERQTRLLALSIGEREAILSVLDDPPPQLCELRAVLLEEHEWRRREGL